MLFIYWTWGQSSTYETRERYYMPESNYNLVKMVTERSLIVAYFVA
jgi:hypothetical protein